MLGLLLATVYTASASPGPLAFSLPAGPEFLFIALFLIIGVGGTLLWIVGLVDVLTNKRLEGTDKIVWVLVVVFLQGLGAILYFLIAPRKSGVRR